MYIQLTVVTQFVDNMYKGGSIYHLLYTYLPTLSSDERTYIKEINVYTSIRNLMQSKYVYEI